MRITEKLKKHDGMTLIEVLVSLGVLSIILLSVFLALEDGQVTALNSARRNQAIGIATTIAEQIKDQSPSIYGTTFSVTLPSTIEGDTATNSQVNVPVVGQTAQTIIMQKFSCTISAALYSSSGSASLPAYQYDVKVFLGTTKQLADVQFVVSTS